ncbi:putative serine/threonine-protein kinase [Aristolochia californica]|uniref:putative serine/threonine-protein kinase n=1 Tax=Aristolochia californica TaxID=171875 RepID=UPI0035D84D9E
MSLRWRRMPEGRQKDARSERRSFLHPDLRLYSHKHLRTATSNFRPLNEIGHGGFGSVFKGKLRDGSVVAIKVLSAQSRQGEREFVAEIDTLSNITHENLLKLRGFCAHGSFRALVYDYMDNSSLAKILLGLPRTDLQVRFKFNWKSRREILRGIANGLAYLHEEIKPSIVHRDIKASNILLDRDLTPKISDFGLAKLFPDSVTHVSTRVAGTLGYLAPEYAIRGQLTPKSDIYSYGVLMLEIISGRCATDFSIATDEPYLVEKAWNLYNAGKLEMMADATLEGEFPVEEVVLFMKVGLLCVQANPSLRPTMIEVVKMLNKTIETGDIQVEEPAQITDFIALKVGTGRMSKNTGSSTVTTSSQSTSEIF